MDVGLKLESTHVVITGGAGLIGSKVVAAFLSAGAHVSSMDLRYPETPKLRDDDKGHPNLLEHFIDTTDEESVQSAFKYAVETFGTVSVCIALAALDFSVLEHHKSSTTLSAAQFRRTLDVNITGTFLTAREWLRGLEAHVGRQRRDGQPEHILRLSNVGLVIVGSESGRFGERTNADYSTSKSAVQYGLLRSLAADAPRVWKGARYDPVALLRWHRLTADTGSMPLDLAPLTRTVSNKRLQMILINFMPMHKVQ